MEQLKICKNIKIIKNIKISTSTSSNSKKSAKLNQKNLHPIDIKLNPQTPFPLYNQKPDK